MRFKYQPILEYGIPHLVEGSDDHERFWNEEERRCKEGYKPTDGVWIPGSYYYALNHRPIDRLRYSPPWSKKYNIDPIGDSQYIVRQPLYRDGNHMIHEKIHQRRQQMIDSGGKTGGLYILKGRQRGLTEDMVAYLDWLMRFFTGLKLSYTTPSEDQIAAMRTKFEVGNENVPDEFAQHLDIRNLKTKKMGLEVPTPVGYKLMGSASTLFTDHITKSSVIKGKNFSVSVIDEVGTFNTRVSLTGFWGDSKDCWKRGDVWTGFPILLGTIDQVNFAKNVDVEKFWVNADTYDLETFLLPADLMYGDYIDLETGISDRPAARKAIKAIRAKLDKLDDKTDLLKETQNQPLDETELFLLSVNDKMDVKRIQAQITRITLDKALAASCVYGKLEWERKKETEKTGDRVYDKYVYTGKTLFIPDPKGLWTRNLLPINHIYPGADIMGVDDYMKDEAPNSDSEGGIVIWRRFINNNEPYKLPVMTYLGRPERLDIFHDEALKGCVYAQCQAAVELQNKMFKEHFLNSKKVTGRDYLKKFPWLQGKKVREEDAYGYNIKDQKDVMAERIKLWSQDPHIENVYDVRYLKNIALFGKANSDLGSATAVCLCYEEDMSKVPVIKASEMEERQELYGLRYEFNTDGTPVQIMPTGGNHARNHFPKLEWAKTLNR